MAIVVFVPTDPARGDDVIANCLLHLTRSVVMTTDVKVVTFMGSRLLYTAEGANPLRDTGMVVSDVYAYRE